MLWEWASLYNFAKRAGTLQAQAARRPAFRRFIGGRFTVLEDADSVPPK